MNNLLTVVYRFIQNLTSNSSKYIQIFFFHVLNLKIKIDSYMIIRGISNNKMSKNKKNQRMKSKQTM